MNTPCAFDSVLRNRTLRLALVLGTAAGLGWSVASRAQPPGPPGEQFKVVTVVEAMVWVSPTLNAVTTCTSSEVPNAEASSGSVVGRPAAS